MSSIIITDSLWIHTIGVRPDDRLKRELGTCQHAAADCTWCWNMQQHAQVLMTVCLGRFSMSVILILYRQQSPVGSLFKASSSRSQIEAKSLKWLNNYRGLFQNLAAFHKAVKVNNVFYTNCNGNSGNIVDLSVLVTPQLTNSNERWIVRVVLTRAKRKMICVIWPRINQRHTLFSLRQRREGVIVQDRWEDDREDMWECTGS